MVIPCHGNSIRDPHPPLRTDRASLTLSAVETGSEKKVSRPTFVVGFATPLSPSSRGTKDPTGSLTMVGVVHSTAGLPNLVLC